MHAPRSHQVVGLQFHRGEGSRPHSEPSVSNTRPALALRASTAGVRARCEANGLVSRGRQSTISKDQFRSILECKMGTYKTHISKPLINAPNRRSSSGTISTTMPPKASPVPTPWASRVSRPAFRHNMWEPAFVPISATPLWEKRTRWFPSHTPSVVDPSRTPPCSRVKPRSTTPTEAQPDPFDSFLIRV